MLAKLLAHQFLDPPWPAPEPELLLQNLSLILISIFWTYHNVSPSVYLNWLVSVLANSHQSMKFIILLLKYVPLMTIHFMLKCHSHLSTQLSYTQNTDAIF